MSNTPETDAAREMWFIKPNVELGDGRPIHGNVVDVEFARRMERDRNAERTVKNSVIKNYDIALERNTTLKRELAEWKRKALEEQRLWASASAELNDLKTFIREEVADEIYGQNKGGPELIAKTRAMVSPVNDPSLLP